MQSTLQTILNHRGAKALLAGGAMFGASLASGDVIYQQDFENWSNAGGLWSSNTQASLGGPYTNVLGRFGTESVRLSILATPSNSSGNSGDEPDTTPFNINVNHLDRDHTRESFPDSSGGGGHGGPIGDTNFDQPQIDLGGTITNGNNTGDPMFGAGIYAVHFDLMLFDSWDGDYAPYGPDSISVAINGQTLFNEFFHSSAYGSGFNFRDPDETPALNAYDGRWIDSIYRDITILVELTEASESLSIAFSGNTSQGLADESWGLDNILVERVSGLRSTPEVPVPGTLAILGGGLGLLGRRKR